MWRVFSLRNLASAWRTTASQFLKAAVVTPTMTAIRKRNFPSFSLRPRMRLLACLALTLGLGTAANIAQVQGQTGWSPRLDRLLGNDAVFYFRVNSLVASEPERIDFDRTRNTAGASAELVTIINSERRVIM